MRIEPEALWEYRWEAFAFLAGIVSATTAAFITDDVVESLILGALVTIGLAVLHDIWGHRVRHRSTRETLSQLCDALGRREGNTARELMLLQWSVGELPAEKMPEVWNSLLWQFDASYAVTNHSLAFGATAPPSTPTQSFYSEHFARFAHDLQALKIHRKATVRRVMIVDTPLELYETLGPIGEQKAAGMRVRYIFASRVMDTGSVLSWKNAGLDSEDFGIFDDSCVLIWHNHPVTRSVTGGRVVWEKPAVKKYIDYFERLYDESHVIPVVSLVGLSDYQRAAVRQWGDYAGRNVEYNYALREGGWLDNPGSDSNATCFAAMSEGRFVGFSILNRDGSDQAEFLLAVHPQLLGRGYGHAITLATLHEGFVAHRLARIHLRVRSWNTRAEEIYSRLGFHVNQADPHGIEHIQGHEVHMTYMQATPGSFGLAGSRHPTTSTAS